MLFLVSYDEDIDSLRFALAVTDFDVESLRPHAPFYPVYVAAAKLVALFGASPQVALGVINAVSGALVVVATAALAREVLGERAGWIAGAFALANPFLWLTSLKLLSDMAGAACTTIALWLLARARRSRDAGEDAAPVPGALARFVADATALRTTAIVLLGLSLGVRLSYFPIALACTAAVAVTEGGRAAWLSRGRDLATGVVLWLVPLVVIGGAAALVGTLWIQGVGHFTRWGGSAITVPSPLQRGAGMVWGAWANCLGGAWPDAPFDRWLVLPVLLALIFVGARACVGVWRKQPELTAAAASYFVWAALGQNVAHKPRHLLPLLPIVLLVIAAGGDWLVQRWRPALVVLGALVVQWLADGTRLARAHQALSPAAALVLHLRETSDPKRVLLTRELGRMVEEAAPEQRVVLLPEGRAPAGVVEQLANAGPDAKVVITGEVVDDEVRRAAQVAGYQLVPVFARPRSRYVDSLWNELTLFELRRR